MLSEKASYYKLDLSFVATEEPCLGASYILATHISFWPLLYDSFLVVLNTTTGNDEARAGQSKALYLNSIPGQTRTAATCLIFPT